MKINIVCYEDTGSWILGKFALCLEKELTSIPGVTCKVSTSPLSGYDITHHIIYIAQFETSVPSIHTTMITHVDEERKLMRVKELISQSVHGICMSSDTRDVLITQGCDPRFLRFAHPAHDFLPARRRISLLITSRLYPDKRKNEDLLPQIFSKLDGSHFKIVIMGSGWELVITELKSKGVEVDYYPDFDKNIYTQLFGVADYFLYLGFDEGSMGYLDALNAGVTPIVSDQGFHKDLKVHEGLYFKDSKELHEILKKIQDKSLNLMKAVETLGWQQYAHKHHEIWGELLLKRPISPHNIAPKLKGLPLATTFKGKHLLRKLRRWL